jgi:hypothetical protein
MDKDILEECAATILRKWMPITYTTRFNAENGDSMFS